MSAEENQATAQANPARPSEFEAIGNKVDKVAGPTNGVEAEDDEKVVQEIESLCMNCHENVSYLLCDRQP